MTSVEIAIASIGVTLLLAGIGYLIKGMLATGQLTQQVAELAVKSEKTSEMVDDIRRTMLRPNDLPVLIENAVLKLKDEMRKELLSKRHLDS